MIHVAFPALVCTSEFERGRVRKTGVVCVRAKSTLVACEKVHGDYMKRLKGQFIDTFSA